MFWPLCSLFEECICVALGSVCSSWNTFANRVLSPWQPLTDDWNSGTSWWHCMILPLRGSLCAISIVLNILIFSYHLQFKTKIDLLVLLFLRLTLFSKVTYFLPICTYSSFLFLLLFFSFFQSWIIFFTNETPTIYFWDLKFVLACETWNTFLFNWNIDQYFLLTLCQIKWILLFSMRLCMFASFRNK